MNGTDMSVSRYLALWSQHPDHGEGQFVGHGIEAAQLLTQQPGKHGDHLQTEDRPMSTFLQSAGVSHRPRSSPEGRILVSSLSFQSELRMEAALVPEDSERTDDLTLP